MWLCEVETTRKDSRTAPSCDPCHRSHYTKRSSVALESARNWFLREASTVQATSSYIDPYQSFHLCAHIYIYIYLSIYLLTYFLFKHIYVYIILYIYITSYYIILYYIILYYIIYYINYIKYYIFNILNIIY